MKYSYHAWEIGKKGLIIISTAHINILTKGLFGETKKETNYTQID